jgi:hypothetical protein
MRMARVEMSMEYAAVLEQAARDQGLTASDVFGLSYEDTARLCGIELGENGESPDDFFYDAYKNPVGDTLAREEAQAAFDDLAQRVAAAYPGGLPPALEDLVIGGQTVREMVTKVGPTPVQPATDGQPTKVG